MQSLLIVDGNLQETLKIVSRSKIIRRSTSLAGIESLWEHRKSSEHEGSNTPENLIQLSVGIEHIKDLIDDVRFSLS